MSQYVETPTKSYPSSSALSAYRRVVLSGGVLAYAAAAEVSIGTLEAPTQSTDERGTVRLRTAQGTRKYVASGAITANVDVFGAASGKISATKAGEYLGKSVEAATADGDVIEVSSAPSGFGVNQSIVAAAAEGSTNSILAGVTGVEVTAVTVDANDWIVLPPIADVPIGHTIRIAANAGANFEMRTPAASNTKINDVDADGSQEYLVTDTHTVIVTKRTSTGWVAQSLTKLGAVVTAVIPD